MKIDVEEVLRERLPRGSKLIPRFAVRWLENFICQDRMNDFLHRNEDKAGVDFAEAALEELGVTYKAQGNLSPSSSRVIFVSNHPLGGLDGMVLASLVSKMFATGKIKFVVNDLLNFVEPLRPIFLGINKHGAQSKEAVRAIDEAFDGDEPIVMFPAGLVSRKRPDGSISDLRWHKMVVNKAISSHRNVIPVHFSGENSQFFYKFANLRTRIGLKFNIEMIKLPSEIFLQERNQFTVTLGKEIAWQSLKGGAEAQAQADELRNIVYSLSPLSDNHD